MPIYEFHCPECNTIYSFRSQRVDTTKRPICPGCGKDILERCVSSFAVVSSAKSGGEDALDDFPIDEARMERALTSMGSDLEHMDENDPRALSQFMRRFSKETGLEYGEPIEEALRRLEAGEDPDAIEAEMGDAFEDEENLFRIARTKGRSLTRKPRRDDTLYDM